jgi:hypothetical protein
MIKTFFKPAAVLMAAMLALLTFTSTAIVMADPIIIVNPDGTTTGTCDFTNTGAGTLLINNDGTDYTVPGDITKAPYDISKAPANTGYAPGTTPVYTTYPDGLIASYSYTSTYFSLHITPSAMSYIRSVNNYIIISNIACSLLNWMCPSNTALASAAPTAGVRNSIGASLAFAEYMLSAGEKNADGSMDVLCYYADMKAAQTSNVLNVYVGSQKHLYKIIWVNGAFDPYKATYDSVIGSGYKDDITVTSSYVQVVLSQPTAQALINNIPVIELFAGVIVTALGCKAGGIPLLETLIADAVPVSAFNDQLGVLTHVMINSMTQLYTKEKNSNGSINIKVFWSDFKKAPTTGTIVVYVGTLGHEYLCPWITGAFNPKGIA